MALLKCADCGRDVSDKAKACPHCGCPTPANEAIRNTGSAQSASPASTTPPLPQLGVPTSEGHHVAARRQRLVLIVGLVGAAIAVAVISLAIALSRRKSASTISDKDNTSVSKEPAHDSGGEAPEASGPITKLTELKDQMCACTNGECAQRASDALTSWSNEESKTVEWQSMSDIDTKRANEIASEFASCRAQMMPNTPDKKPTPAPITEAQAQRVLDANKQEVSMVTSQGDALRFFAKKTVGPSVFVVSVVSMSGNVLASITTDAESEGATGGFHHQEPIAAVGVVNNSLVFVGGSTKVTGKGGFSAEARVFRSDESGRMVQVQKLAFGLIATETGFDHITPPSEQPIQPLQQRGGECKADRALIGLDKVSIVCHVDNPNARAFAIHIMASLVSDNFSPHIGETDAVIPPLSSKDTKIVLNNVDFGRSQNPRCVCKVTSPDVVIH